MADYFSRALAAADDAELIDVQQPGRANVPYQANVPYDASAPRLPQQQQRRPMPAPQRQPPPVAVEPPQVQAAPQIEPPLARDQASSWFDIMSKHGIPTADWPKYSDIGIAAHMGAKPDTGNPALDADIAAFMAKNPLRPKTPAPPSAAPPSAAPAQAAPPAMAQPPQQAPDYFGRALGSQPQPQQAAPQVTNPNAEPDAPTWLGRRMQDVRGKQDPRFQNLPNIASVIQQRGQSWGDLTMGEVAPWMLGASDNDMAKSYQSMLGRDFIRTEQDANGYPVVVYNDKGQEKRAYVNNPGMDMQDVARGAYGMLPFAKTAQWAGRALKSAPLIGRMGGQAITAAGTSLAVDAAAAGTGVSDLDPMGSVTKAGIAAAGGAGGEAVGTALGALVRRFRTEPRLYNAQAGKLTPEGEAAARAAGVDPLDLSQRVAEDFAKTFARTGDPEAAFRQAASNEFGIRRTAGELSGNKNQLLREQQYRGGTYGDDAMNQVKAFDKLQQEDIGRAVMGVSPPGSQNPTIASQIAPARRYQLAAGMDKAKAGENIRGNTQDAYGIAKSQEKQLWEAVPTMQATPEALGDLAGTIERKFAELSSKSGRPLIVDNELTPMAARMAKELEGFKSGQAPAKASSILPDNTVGDIDTMRRRLLAIRQKAADDTDRRSARALYDSFLDWQVEAAAKSGDMLAAAKARSAREATRQLQEIFGGEKGTPAASILQSVLKKADTPEGVINALMTGPTAEIKNGSVTAIQQLKRAYETYLEPAAAKEAIDDLRLAFVVKHMTDKGAEVRNPAALASAIRNMMGTQGSVARELLSPAEISMFRRLAVVMDDVKQKNPNTSWSGIAVGALMKDGLNAILNQIGWNSTLGRTLAGPAVKPFQNAWGRAQAARATGNMQGGSLPAIAPPSLSGLGGALGAQSQQ